MSPVVDFTSVKGLEPLPEGTYLAKVVHSEEGLSSAQQPKIEMRWEIIAPEEYAGRQVFDILSFHPDALFRTKATLVGMGYGDDFSGEINADSLMDKECAITITIDNSGKTDEDGNPYPPRNKVRKVRPASKYNTTNGSANPALEAMSVPAVTARPARTTRTK